MLNQNNLERCMSPGSAGACTHTDHTTDHTTDLKHARLMFDEYLYEIFMLSDLGPLLLLRQTSVFAGGQTQLQLYLTLYIGTRGPTLQLKPLLNASRWNVLLKKQRLPQHNVWERYRTLQSGS